MEKLSLLIFAMVFSLMTFFIIEDAKSSIPAYRFCRIIKYEGKHYRAIVQKIKLNEYKLIKLCFKDSPIDDILDANMCIQGGHVTGDIWFPNREYLSIVCEYNYEHYKVLHEQCWKNCGPMETGRVGCEYKYPRSCFIVKNLFNSNPCKAYEE